MDDHSVVIDVRDEEEKQIAPLVNPKFGFYFVVISLAGYPFISQLILGLTNHVLRTQLFKNHGGLFTIIAIVTSSLAVLASAVLICTSYFLQTWMRDIHYTIIKSIGCLPAMLAPFSLFVALFAPDKFNWHWYLVISIVFFGILVAYCCFWKRACLQQQQEEEEEEEEDTQINIYFPSRVCLGFVALPILALLSSFIPNNLRMIRDAARCFIILFMFVIFITCLIKSAEDKESEESNLEEVVIQQDKTNTHP